MEFKFDKLAAKLKPNASIISAGTQSRGGSAVKTADVKIITEISIDKDAKGVEFLFPGLDLYLKEVAGLEHYKGEDRASRTSLPEMNVEIFYGEDSIFEQTNCPIKGKPTVKINKAGEAILVLRILTKLSSTELAKLAEHIDADIRLSLSPAQVDLEHTLGGENVVKMRAKV